MCATVPHPIVSKVGTAKHAQRSQQGIQTGNSGNEWRVGDCPLDSKRGNHQHWKKCADLCTYNQTAAEGRFLRIGYWMACVVDWLTACMKHFRNQTTLPIAAEKQNCRMSLIHTYIHTYLLTYLNTYIHTYLHTYLPTYIHTYTGQTERRTDIHYTYVSYMRSSLNSVSRIRTKITLTAYLQDCAFRTQLFQQILNISEESCEWLICMKLLQM